MTEKDSLFLIIDDEPDMCWALETLLEKNGVRSKKALTGEEALTLMEQGCFSMIFLDAKLPDIEGLELARRLKKVDPTIPIVMVSGYFYRDDKDIKEAVAQGLISGFIGKPFVHDEILKTLKANISILSPEPKVTD